LTDINHFGLGAQALLHQSDGERAEDPCKCNASPAGACLIMPHLSRRLAKVHRRHVAAVQASRAHGYVRS
jgi:hypothetical protein